MLNIFVYLSIPSIIQPLVDELNLIRGYEEEKIVEAISNNLICGHITNIIMRRQSLIPFPANNKSFPCQLIQPGYINMRRSLPIAWHRPELVTIFLYY